MCRTKDLLTSFIHSFSIGLLFVFLLLFFFFFFQAEDGIRDRTVTGVQTCALPISVGPGTKLPTLGHMPSAALREAYAEQVRGLLTGGVDAVIVETAQDILQAKRSEERRVGKECRSRWRAEQKKKKKDRTVSYARTR